jgi:hypothetical protein
MDQEPAAPQTFFKVDMQFAFKGFILLLYTLDYKYSGWLKYCFS